MATGVSLTLPWPPSANRYWRHIAIRGKPRTLISAEGRAYRKAVADAVLIQRGNKHLQGRLAVTIIAQPPDRRRRDIDNINKALLDALTHAGVYEDDGNIDFLASARASPVKGGRILIHIASAELFRPQWLEILPEPLG